MQANLLEALEAKLRTVGAQAFTVAPAAQPSASCDATVVVRDEAFADVGRDAAAQDRDVSAVAPCGGRFELRYMNDTIAALGAALESGTPAGMETDDLLAGELVVVDVGDDDGADTADLATVRPVVRAQALAATLEAAGAEVRLRSVDGGGGGAAAARLRRWFDPLSDALCEAPTVRAAAHEGRARTTPADLAAITLRGLCLDPVAEERSEPDDPARLLDAHANRGWLLARAWARAWSPLADGDPAPAPADPAYRYVVMQAQCHRAQVRAVAERRDPCPFAHQLGGLAEWYLQTPPSPPVDRLLRRVLGSGLEALGLVRGGALSSASGGR